MKTIWPIIALALVAIGCSKSASQGDAKQLKELQERVGYLEYGVKMRPAPAWVTIDPKSKAYQIIGTSVFPLLIKSEDATQYLNGYKIKIAVGNPYFVSFSGFKLTARWDKPNDSWSNYGKPQFMLTSEDKTNDVSKDNPPESKGTVEQHTEKLSPGTWTTIEFIVAPANLDDLKDLRIKIDMDELSLRESSN